jgi:hypothetical protein
MTLSPIERAFLEKLARQPQGRCSYALVRRDDAMEIAGGLVAEGYIRNRRCGYDEGFQITPKGRAYLEGQAHDL